MSQVIDRSPAWHAREISLLLTVPLTGGWETYEGDPAVLIGWARIRDNTERALVTIARREEDHGYVATMFFMFHGGVISIHSDGYINATYAVQGVLGRVEKDPPMRELTPTVETPFPPGTVVKTTRATPPAATCENCRFWRTRGGDHEPECRRHPPTRHVNSAWPTVTQWDWCGEYESIGLLPRGERS